MGFSFAEYADVILIAGCVVLAFAFPSAVGAYSRGAPLRIAVFSLFLGGAMIVYANSLTPGGYTVAELPEIVVGLLYGT